MLIKRRASCYQEDDVICRPRMPHPPYTTIYTSCIAYICECIYRTAAAKTPPRKPLPRYWFVTYISQGCSTEYVNVKSARNSIRGANRANQTIFPPLYIYHIILHVIYNIIHRTGSGRTFAAFPSS
jgi:hypothetical protein